MSSKVSSMPQHNASEVIVGDRSCGQEPEETCFPIKQRSHRRRDQSSYFHLNISSPTYKQNTKYSCGNDKDNQDALFQDPRHLQLARGRHEYTSGWYVC